MVKVGASALPGIGVQGELTYNQKLCPHIKGRAFHAFRRSLATVLVERLSVSHASGWLGDTVEVLLRSYVKPSVEAQGEAAAYLMHLWNEEIDPQQPNARYPKSVPV